MKTSMSVLLISIICCCFSIVLSATSNTYEEFNLTQSPITLSISNRGALDAGTALNTSILNEKQCAIAMAIGYCTFLNVSGVEQDMTTAGLSSSEISNIINTFNVNEWLATSFLESDIQGGISSGFYQIDDLPSNMQSDASQQVWSQQEKKMVYILGDKEGYFNFLKGLGTTNLYANNQESFIWESVEKGYYESLAYLLNRENSEKNFNFAQWSGVYSLDQSANTHYPLSETEFPNVMLSPNLGFAQSMWYMYNSGYSPFGNNSPLLQVWLQSNNTFQNVIQYNNGNPHDAYIWRMGWLVTLLNQSTDQYNESVSLSDFEGVLNILSGFYTQGNPGNDDVVKAGLQEAASLTWGYPYNSSETFNNINSVVETMLAQSIQNT